MPQSAGPIVQVCEYRGSKRLVVALPNSAILSPRSATVAKWTFVSGPKLKTKDECENVVYPPGKGAHQLAMENGLPYLSKEFWLAMLDISTKLTWSQQVQEPQSQIYSVKTVTVPKTPMVALSQVSSTKHFKPWKARQEIVAWFEEFHPPSNPNRGRISGTAKLTSRAQTGRSSKSKSA